MGTLKGPTALLAAAVLIYWFVMKLHGHIYYISGHVLRRAGEHSESLWQPSQHYRRRQLSQNYANASLDEGRERDALLALYDATQGATWRVANLSSKEAVPWGTEGVSYCRWYGVTCCATSPLFLVDCEGAHSVVILSLDSFGLSGSLPDALGDLRELTVLALGNNPRLVGGLPQSMSQLTHLLWVSVEDTGIVSCMEASAATESGGSLLPPPLSGPCTLPASLAYSHPYSPYGTSDLTCPLAILKSFLSYTSDLSPDVWDIITSPFPRPPTPGAVIAGANFTRFFNCSCHGSPSMSLVVSDLGPAVGAQCLIPPGSSGSRYTGLVVGIVLACLLPWLLGGWVIYICVTRKASLHRLVQRKEAEMARKRSKVPGTPGVALQNGRGLLSLSDVMVTWVVTDVAASTQLWEWKPDVMDRAIDRHNTVLRRLIDEFGGHEIRNEGDSFTLSFHDAVDAVMFCLKAQETLMAEDWPKELAEHPQTGVVSVGDVTSNPDAAGKGPLLIKGLRVRMGINTGVPDDIFLHDLTDHVDYRGLEYDLAGEICDLAEGGQVLMGPRTLQRWNKVNYSALIDPDILRDQQGGSFAQVGVGGQQPALLHGPSGRRSSVTGFGGLGVGGLSGGLGGLGRDSQQHLQAYYGGTLGGIGSASAAAAGNAGVGTVAGSAGGASSGYTPLSNLPNLHRNSDLHPQTYGSGMQASGQLSGDEEIPEDENSSQARAAAGGMAAPALTVLPAARSIRRNCSRSPSWGLRSTFIAQIDRVNGSGATAGASPAPVIVGGAVTMIAGSEITGAPHGSDGRSTGHLGLPFVPRAPLPSNLSSPRVPQASGLSYNEGAALGRCPARETPPTGTGVTFGREDSDSRTVASPVPRASNTQALLHQHAAQAAQMAVAAVAAARSAATGLNSHGAHGHPESGSDDDRGSSARLLQSPRQEASVPLPPRLSNALARTGSIGDRPSSGGPGRRRGDDSDHVGVSGASAPMPVVAGLQRFISHGWRGLQVSVLPPRVQVGHGPGMELSAPGTASPSHPAAQLQTPGAGATRSCALGRVVRSRLNGTLHGVAAAAGPTPVLPIQQLLRNTGVTAAGLSNCDSSEGQPSLSVVPLEDDDRAATAAGSGGAGTSSRSGLNRIYSLPTAHTFAAASSYRAAPLQRCAAEASSREGSPRQQGQGRKPGPSSFASFFQLQKPSRDRSRNGVSSPTSADSPVTNLHQQQSAEANGLSLGLIQGAGEMDSAGAGGGGSGGRCGSRSAAVSAPPPPLALSPSGGRLGSFDAAKLSGPSRRALVGLPGPPRMSLANEAGLHPLLLNPMQPGSLAALPGLRMPVALRHPQQLAPRPLMPSLLRTDNGLGTPPAALQDHVTRTGDSTSSAGNMVRGITLGSVYRPMPEPQRTVSLDGSGAAIGGGRGGSGSGSGGGGVGGPSGGQHGGSGSPLKLAGSVHQLNGATAQLSYHPNATSGYNYLDRFLPEVDGGAIGGIERRPAIAPTPPLLRGAPQQCWPLLLRLQLLWLHLLRAFRHLLRRCLICVKLLTSSDDDPADVDIWEHTEGTVLGSVVGAHRTAGGGSKPQETKGVLVDMGYYHFTPLDYGAGAAGGDSNYVHLMQIVPSSVAARVLMFSWPLALPVGWEKISPGFFDAAGSSRLMFPDMRELMGGDLQAIRPVVTVAFSSIEGFKELSAVSVDAGRDVLQLHNAAVRETLSTCSGYECKEFNGSFMTTFASPTSAVEWALTLQLALVAMPWPEDLLNCEAAAVVLNPENNALLFRGLRCRVGIYAGAIDRVTPHAKTGRADYFGQPVNRAARLMTAALGGQVVLDQNLLDEVLEEWRRRQEVRRLATIPSVEEGSVADEGSLRAPSEMRQARSFVSAKSTNSRLRHMSSTAASSTPSVTTLPELSMQHISARTGGQWSNFTNIYGQGGSAGSGGDGGTPTTTTTTGGGATIPSTGTATNSVAGAVNGLPVPSSGSARADALLLSPFSRPGSHITSTMRSSGVVKEIGPDTSRSPMQWRVRRAGSVNFATSASAAASVALGKGASGAAATMVDPNDTGNGSSSGGLRPAVSASSAGGLVRSLERLLTDPKVQRSARSEPRIQRVSRLGLSGLTAVLRDGSGGNGRPASGSPRCGVSTRGAGVAASAGCDGSGPHPAAPTVSSPSIMMSTTEGLVPWLPEAGNLPGVEHHTRSSSFIHHSFVGGGGGGGGSSAGALWPTVGGPRSQLQASLVVSAQQPSQSSPSRSVIANALGIGSVNGGQPTASCSGGTAGGHGGGSNSAPGAQIPSWMASALQTHTSHSSMAGGLSAGGASDLSVLAAAGLELQPADWDPVSRQAAASRARRRRRASVGEIVGGMLQLTAQGQTVASSPSRGTLMGSASRHDGSNMVDISVAHSFRGGGASGSQTPGCHTPGRSPSRRISPAVAGMRARLLLGSPQSTGSGGSCSAATVRGLNFSCVPGASLDAPDSPCASLTVLSPRSVVNSKTPSVRRTGSSPLGMAQIHTTPSPEASGTDMQLPGSESSMTVQQCQRFGGCGGTASSWSTGSKMSAVPPLDLPTSSRHRPQHRHHSFQQPPGSGVPLDARNLRYMTSITTTMGQHQHHPHQFHYSHNPHTQQALSASRDLVQQVHSTAPQMQDSGMPSAAYSMDYRLPEDADIAPLQQNMSDQGSFGQGLASANPFPHRSLGGLLASVAEAPTPSSGSTLNLAPETSGLEIFMQELGKSALDESGEDLRRNMAQLPLRLPASVQDWSNASLMSCNEGSGHSLREGNARPSGRVDPGTTQQGSSARTAGAGDGQNGMGISDRLGNAQPPWPATDLVTRQDYGETRVAFPANEDLVARGSCVDSNGGGGDKDTWIKSSAADTGSGDFGPAAVTSIDNTGPATCTFVITSSSGVSAPPLLQDLEGSQSHKGSHLPAASTADTSSRTSLASRTSAPSSPTSRALALVPMLAQRETDSERAAPQPNRLLHPLASMMLVNAGSSFIRRMYDTGSSTGASCQLGDSEAMPSFAANLQKAAGESPDGCGATAAGNGDIFSGHTSGLVRTDSDFCSLPQPPLVRSHSGRSNEGPTMLGRGFVTLHGNPMYLAYRSMTGRVPIAEVDDEGLETCSGDTVAAVEDGAMAQSLELVTTNKNSHTTPPPAAREGTRSVPTFRPPSKQKRQAAGRQTAPAPPTCSSSTGIGGDTSGGLFQRVPPPVALPPPPHYWLGGGVAKAKEGAHQLSDGPQHWSMGASVSMVNSSQPPPGPPAPAPSTFTAGGHYMSRNSSGGTMQAMMVASMESPASDVCCLRYSSTNDEDLAPFASSQLSGSAPAQHAIPAPTSLAHAARTSLGALHGAGFCTAIRTHFAPADMATLMKLGAGSSDGRIGAGSSGGGGGGTVRVTRRSGGGAMAAVVGAAPPLACSSTLTTGRRRASSGAIGVSFHAAVEAAISQMQPGSSFNRQSDSQFFAAAFGAPGSSPARGLRKSMSSWGRRNPSESRAPTSSGSPLNDVAAGAATTIAAFVGIRPRSQRTVWRRARRPASETSGSLLSPAIEQLAAFVTTQGGLDPRTLHHSDRGMDAMCAAAPVAGVASSRMPVASAPIRSDGGLNTACGRGAAALRRSAPGHPLPVTGSSVTGVTSGTGAANGSGGLPSIRTSVSGTSYQASEAPRAPARATASDDATVSMLMAAAASARMSMTGRLQASHGDGAGDASGAVGCGTGCQAGSQRAYDSHQPGFFDPAGTPATISTVHFSTGSAVTGVATAGDPSIDAGSVGFMGRSRRSSASSQVIYGVGGSSSPGHVSLAHPVSQAQTQMQTQFQQQQRALQPPPSHLVMATTTSVHSRHGAIESHATSPYTGPPVQTASSISRGSASRTSCSFVMGGRNAGGLAGMSLVSGTAPGTPHGSLAGPSGGDSISALRATMQRSSTPELPVFMPLGTTVSSNPAAGGTGSGVVPYLQMSRLRASNQSLPEDIIAGVGAAAASASAAASMSRELGRPPDSAATQISNPGGLGLGPGTCRGSWWRSPRTQSVLLPGEEGSRSTGGGGGTGQGGGPTPDKAAHTPGSPEVMPAISSGAGGIGAGGVGAAIKAEKENRPAVMAECYKITQQPTGGVGSGGGNEVAQSITMIKYTNLKQKLTHDAEEPDDVLVPTNMLMVPTVSVEVAIWSLGVFRLKGVTEPIKIVQVLPVELEGRLAILNKAGLNRGKARCIERRVTCLDVITLQLPDVSQLSCVAVAEAAAAAAAAAPAGGSGDEILLSCAEGPADDGVDNGMVDRLGLRATDEVNTEVSDGVGGGEMEANGDAVSQDPVPQLLPSVPYMQGLANPDGTSAAPPEAVERRGVISPILPGQATTSPADAGGRWAGLQVQKRSDTLCEVESSGKGLPPISEVATPVGSPLPCSREPVTTAATSMPGAASRCDSVHMHFPNENPGQDPDANSTASLRHEWDGATGGNRIPGQLQDLACGPPLGASEAPCRHVFRVPSLQTAPGELPYQRNTNHRNYSQPQPVDPVGPYASRGGETEYVTSVNSTADGRPSDTSLVVERHSPVLPRAAGETASAAPLSTGPLPSSLSYLTQQGTRDTMSTFAAMVSAGIVDIRSPGGSPVNTPLPVARDNMLLTHDAASGTPLTGADMHPDPEVAAAANGWNP
ncbi:hypothetical protein VaNZ11_014183 [Volvox africanus]|uniref:Guanylate cyclase domain-containing protein n=1 Tax=Volvox africanus TaxID=51714 RepID=A0ABQ5SJ82_9CHLO|nr:hypothetical protein VaNZ11_014183 [Volvox africanus]